MRKRLTAQFVSTTRTFAKREEYFDTDEHGLMLRISRRGAKSWAFRYRRKGDGRRCFISLGRFPHTSLEAARVAAAKARVSVFEGADPATVVQLRKAAPNFREIVTEWQATHASFNRSRRVQADDLSMLNRHILPRIGEKKAGDITRRELSALLAAVSSAADGRKGHGHPGGAKPRRLTHRPNRVFELVRAIMRWAHQNGIVAVDPTNGLKRPIRKEAARERELSPTEVVIFWRNVDKLPATPALRIMLKIALATAQRIGEVCGAEKAELALDVPEPMWVIPPSRTKNGEPQRVPLSPLAVELFRKALALQGPPRDEDHESVWIFPARAKRDRSKGPILPGAASVALFRGRTKMGLQNFRVHDLRRTAATRMAEMGINPHTISHVLNHISVTKSTVTAKVYVRYSFDREKRDALNAWGEMLRKIVTLPI